MKTKKLTSLAALIAALAISITSAKALTFNQVQEIKKAVLGVPVPEMPAKAAELVSKAEKKDKQATAVTAVRAVIVKHRAAAPLIISAISKVAPEIAPAVALAAAELATEQAPMIARAAATAAPEQAQEINLAVSKAVPTTSTMAANVNATGADNSTAPSVFERRSASSGGATQGNPTISNTRINGGTFGSNPSRSGSGVVIYNQPPAP
jgi:hypothetical protein